MTKRMVSRESFAARIWRKTLDGVGVKIGFAWIGLLVFAAVFAPFLANSMPLLMSKDGVISAPVLKYLSVEDVWVLANFFLALIIYRLRIAVGKRVLLFLLGSALIAVLANLFIKPPMTIFAPLPIHKLIGGLCRPFPMRRPITCVIWSAKAWKHPLQRKGIRI